MNATNAIFKRYYIDPRISPLLYKELTQSRLAKGSLQADKNSRDDAITALGYSRTMTRYHVKKSFLTQKTEPLYF